MESHGREIKNEAEDKEHLEINSNDFEDSEEEKQLHFASNKNSVNCSWKEQNGEADSQLAEDVETVRPYPMAKDKNFTFVQSEIDAEMAKNILYSDTGFQIGGNAEEGPEQRKVESGWIYSLLGSKLGVNFRFTNAKIQKRVRRTNPISQSPNVEIKPK